MAATSTIFERYGGFTKVRRIVSDFYDRCLDSPLIGARFEKVAMARLIDHQSRFIAYVMGGPASYTDDQLQRVHAPLRISAAEFDEMVGLLRETLDDHGLASADVDLVCREVERRELLIVSRAQ